MATVNLQRFSEADALKELSPASLLGLLGPHSEFLVSKGVVLPPPNDGAVFDYEALAKIFLVPDDIPKDLVEKFHLVRQMSGKDAMDGILDAVARRQPDLVFTPNSSPMDIAAQLLVMNKKLFQEVHAEQAVDKYRSFTYFVTHKKAPGFKPPADLSGLEAALNVWYEKHRRGRTARVFWRQKDNEFWFYVRHAEPIKRDGSVGMTDNQSGSTIYRPERHDLVVYDADAVEMRVHADAKNEPELFRECFGEHLFGDKQFFPKGKEKYTLDPLKTKQRASLVCAGIEGLVNITLKEIEFFRHGTLWERETHSAEDVFTAFEARNFVIPESCEVRKAKFAVRFADAARPRMVTIRPSNYILYGRDYDAVLVGKWLFAQDFALKEEIPNDDEDGALE